MRASRWEMACGWDVGGLREHAWACSAEGGSYSVSVERGRGEKGGGEVGRSVGRAAERVDMLGCGWGLLLAERNGTVGVGVRVRIVTR